MPDNGKEVRVFHSKYEKLLIKKGALKDNSGKSYYQLFESVIKEIPIDLSVNYSLIDSINKLSYSSLVHSNEKCIEEIKKNRNYKYSKTSIIKKKLDSLMNDLESEKVSEVFLSVLDSKDFELEFYKLRTLLMLEKYKFKEEIEESEEIYSKERILNSLEIHLSKDSQILISKEFSPKEKLKEVVKSYILKNKEKSLIKLSVSRDLLFNKYVDFINYFKLIFSEIKNELSNELYYKNYDKLTVKEVQAFNSVYSFEVYEAAPQ